MINGIYKNDEEFFKEAIDIVNLVCAKDDVYDSYVVQYKLLNIMIGLRGYDKLPKVISDAEFDKMPRKVVYRGTDNIEYHANMLCDFCYRKGRGWGSDGLYFSPDYYIALEYTGQNISKDEQILRAKISPKANTIDMEDLGRIVFNRLKNKKYDLLKELISKDNEHSSDLFMVFEQNIAILAIMLGYDAILFHDSVIVLNRSIINVSKSEFDRIVSKSKYYNLNGTINFEKKYEDNYFPDV